MRKIHTGLPGLTVKTLSFAVLPDMNEFEFEQPAQEQLWKEIEKDNKFYKKIESALKETLFIGDGAFKVAIDTTISDYPILEWYPGERVEFVYQRDRIREIVFNTPYKEKGKVNVLNERYGYGYINNELYLDNKLVDIKSIKATENLTDITFDDSIMLAEPFMIYESSRYEGRGGSIFDGKLDSYDSLDETWSQWMDALRAGRAKTYIPECLVPHDPETGMLIKPNPFDNRYFAADGDMREGQKNQVITDQPTIPHDSYMASYITALDLCLQGVISPSTLGIDVKKLDNAEAQREKEKTTNPASFAKSPKIEDMEYTTSSNTICWDGRTGYKQLMLKSSSSKRYKDIGNNISEQEIEEWYNIEPTWAKYKKGYLVKGDENEGRYIPMFIAENVEAFFPEATRHQNGLVEDWNERIMIPAMFAMLKNQKAQLDRQEKLIKKLYETLNIKED